MASKSIRNSTVSFESEDEDNRGKVYEETHTYRGWNVEEDAMQSVPKYWSEPKFGNSGTANIRRPE